MEQEIAEWRDCATRYFVPRVADVHLVEDFVQETCLRAWISQRDGRIDRVGGAWIIGISWRALAQHRRRFATRANAVVCETDVRHSIDLFPQCRRERSIRIGDEDYPLSKVLAALDRCVRSMPAKRRGLFELRMVGASLETIARQTGLSVNVVKLRLYRGRRALREAILASLREEEVDAIPTIET